MGMLDGADFPGPLHAAVALLAILGVVAVPAGPRTHVEHEFGDVREAEHYRTRLRGIPQPLDAVEIQILVFLIVRPIVNERKYRSRRQLPSQ